LKLEITVLKYVGITTGEFPSQSCQIIFAKAEVIAPCEPKGLFLLISST